MTTFYKKIGRKYIPVSEYNDELTDSFTYGSHLVTVNNNSYSRRKIEPALAPVVAASLYAKDVITKAVMDATALRPATSPLTEEQRAAWEALEKAFGNTKHSLTWQSAVGVADDVLATLQEQANMLLLHPSVKHAYEEFMIICKLTKE